MLEIPEVEDVDIAFGARALDWMPPYEEIPEEFKGFGHNEWCKIARRWFYEGLSKDTKVYPKDGVDLQKAFRVLQATQGSFAPKHEHKEAAVAYMMSEWFDKIEGWEK